MPAPQPNPLLTAARSWFNAGYCVVPSHEDGGKRPFGRWKAYQAERLPWADLEALLSTGHHTGIGVINGAVSGNSEMIELEGPMDAAVERLGRVIARAAEWEAIGIPDLLARIARGCVEQSAGGGLHLFIRVTDGPALGNTKLARTADGKVVSETRGEGGFVIVAPTPGRNGHPEGASYLFINGGHPANTVEVTSEERDILHLLFSSALDEYTDDLVPATTSSTPTTAHEGLSAFDDYRQRVTWRDILAPLGWREGPTMADGRTHWTRPGGTTFEGTSATTIEDGPLFVFSTSVDMPQERGLSKGQVYAYLHHGGDMSAAARALSEAGYGDAVSTTVALPTWDMPAVEPDAPVPVPTLADEEQVDLHQMAVLRKYGELRIMEDAKALIQAAKAAAAPDLEGVDLHTFLSQPDDPVTYRIDALWPEGGRVLLAAAAKSGKTTLVAANVLPSLVDGRQFLGLHTATTVDGNVVMLNMEVGENTMRRWMRDAGIQSTSRVIIANLRGKASAVSIASPQGRKRFAAWLAGQGAGCVILDPLAPLLAALGLDENSNADVATFFSWWGEALELAGVRDDLVTHHTGHAGQRSRGASRLLDEPDAIWTLTREDDEATGEFSRLDPVRYLSAFGRDVEMHPEALEYDPATRGLRLTGKGKAETKADRDAEAVLDVFKDRVPRSVKRIADDSPYGRNKGEAIVKRLIQQGVLEQVHKTPNGYWTYLPTAMIEED